MLTNSAPTVVILFNKLSGARIVIRESFIPGLMVATTYDDGLGAIVPRSKLVPREQVGERVRALRAKPELFWSAKLQPQG